MFATLHVNIGGQVFVIKRNKVPRPTEYLDRVGGEWEAVATAQLV